MYSVSADMKSSVNTWSLELLNYLKKNYTLRDDWGPFEENFIEIIETAERLNNSSRPFNQYPIASALAYKIEDTRKLVQEEKGYYELNQILKESQREYLGYASFDMDHDSNKSSILSYLHTLVNNNTIN